MPGSSRATGAEVRRHARALSCDSDVARLTDVAPDPDYLARIDRHLDRQDELMAEIRQEMSLSHEEMRLSREEMRLSREERAAQAERFGDLRVFTRDLVTRLDRGLERIDHSLARNDQTMARNDQTLQRLDRTLDGIGRELKDVREQGNALTAAVLAFLDRLNGAGGSAPAT